MDNEKKDLEQDAVSENQEEQAAQAQPEQTELPEQLEQTEPHTQTELLTQLEKKAAPKAGKQNGLGKALRSTKFKRGGMSTLMSVVFIAIVVVVNILVGALTQRFPSMDIDLTAQKLNSLSDQALEIAKGVENDTTIYLIGSEDSYRTDSIYSSYGFSYSQVANLADKLREANSKISVEFIDPDTNPTFISDYSDDNLTTGKVLVETAKRKKVLTVSDMFDYTQNSTTGAGETYSKVDSALAGALEMVNLDTVPVFVIATGHDELLTSSTLSSFISMMEEDNFDVQEIDFLTEELPEDTQVLMLPTPTTDYTQEELNKIREYLDDTSRENPLTLLVTCYPTQGELPNFANFLEEWGVKIEQGMVAETDSSRMVLRSQAFVLVDPSEEILADNSYSNLVAANSTPLTVLFAANGDVGVNALWTTSDSAYVVTDDMTEDDLSSVETGAQVVTTLSTKNVKVNGNYTERNVVVFGSSYVFTDTFINASAFGDKTYLSDLLKYATGTDGSAVTVVSTSVQTNVLDVTASAATIVLLGLGVFTIGLPLAILIAGLVVFLKRRHL